MTTSVPPTPPRCAGYACWQRDDCALYTSADADHMTMNPNNQLLRPGEIVSCPSFQPSHSRPSRLRESDSQQTPNSEPGTPN